MSRAVLVGLVAVLLALAGCSAIADLGELRQELRSAGYNATNLDYTSTNGVDVLTVGVAGADEDAGEEDAAGVAEIVWTRYPAEIDRLVVVVNGAVRLEATDDELTERFGERPAGVAAAREEGGSPLLIILICVGAAVFAGLMVLVWWRGRRPPPPVAPPYPPQYPNQYPPQYPPQNPPQYPPRG
jgi:hypothetical protein